MANYVAVARSTYFRVKDEASFRSTIADIPDLGLYEHTTAAGIKEFAIHAADSDSGGWPQYFVDDVPDEDEPLDLTQILAPHLAEDSIAVLMEIGNEKMRYLGGHAVAVDSNGEVEHVDLNDIFQAASQTLKGTTGEW